VVIFVTTGLVAAGFLFLVFWAQQPEHSLLFSRLSPEDSSAIIEKLKNQRIPYELTEGGKAIMVPAERVHELRLQLAADGLPQSGGVGFELFDKSTFGMTEFVQKLNYLRAMQGELSRTITQLEAVDQARVHVVMPEKTLFKEDQHHTTASIVMKLKRGRKLGAGQVQGVVHLTASAVEGLDPENITVVDIHGNILSGGGDSGAIAKLTSTQLEYKQNYEKGIENRIQTMLENVIGNGKIIARVNTELDFLQEERMEEIFDPDSQVARSETMSTDSSVGSQQISGVPGVQSNIPEAGEQIVQKSTPPKSSRTNETRNFELNKITRKIIEPVGRLTKLSVAVVLDGTYEMDGESGEPKYIPRSDSAMKEYENLVKSAIGFNAERGDVVEVSNMPFDSMKVWDERKAMEADANRLFYLEMVKYLLSGIALFIIVFFVLKPAIQWLISLEREVVSFQGPKTVAELEREMAGKGEGEEEYEVEKKEDYRKRVVEFVTENPQGSAEMLRKWLRERTV